MRSFSLFAAVSALAAVAASESPAPIPKGANSVLPPTDVSLDKRDLCVLGLCIGGSSSSSSSSKYDSDVNNCGRRGNVCTSNWLFGGGRQCVNGVCAASYCNNLFDFNWLTGQCQDVSSDTSNCGKCGQSCSVDNATGTKCVSGSCYATGCQSGYTLASGVCSKNVDTTSDVNNCGALKNKCPSSYSNGSGSICLNSVCQPQSCKSGYAFDYAKQVCRDILNDSNNCGSCGSVCSFPNGFGGCSNGNCVLKSCNNNYYNVNGVCTKLDLQNDAENCGKAGNSCTNDYANGVGACKSGSCYLASCNTGYELKTSYFLFWSTSTTCEAVDTTSDDDNCGAVGKLCGGSVANGGTPHCKNSKCVASCDYGYSWDQSSLTCMNTNSDLNNCGGIGETCSVDNGTAQCKNGVCTVKDCNDNYVSKNGKCVYYNKQNDVNNCGGLNILCPSSYKNGGIGLCVLGKCTTTCDLLFDFDWGLGYCRDVSSDVNNCGKCGNTCTLTGAKATTCNKGNCLATACNDGYTLSNGVCNKADYTSDVNNCGAKGKVCQFLPSGASGVCKNSVCQLTSCPTAYVLKDGVCVKSTASQRARLAKKDTKITAKSLCPGSETACPIAGSSTFDAALEHHFSNEQGLFGAPGGYECLDTTSAIDSCGGCASTGEGKNCQMIRGVQSAGCEDSQCRVFSCVAGWKPSLDGTKCVRVKAGSHGHSRNSSSSSSSSHTHSKKHLAARHHHVGSSTGHL
ncbi:hypothetical protein JCM8547_006221 [Rhodosporidiobolus lusitaniae]